MSRFRPLCETSSCLSLFTLLGTIADSSVSTSSMMIDQFPKAMAEETNTAEVVICVVDISRSISDAISAVRSTAVKTAVSNGATLIILVDRMQVQLDPRKIFTDRLCRQEIQWDSQPYLKLSAEVEATTQDTYGQRHVQDERLTEHRIADFS